MTVVKYLFGEATGIGKMVTDSPAFGDELEETCVICKAPVTDPCNRCQEGVDVFHKDPCHKGKVWMWRRANATGFAGDLHKYKGQNAGIFEFQVYDVLNSIGEQLDGGRKDGRARATLLTFFRRMQTFCTVVRAATNILSWRKSLQGFLQARV